MSETPASQVGVSTGAANTQAPAPKLTAIQLIEQQIKDYVRQREQAIANVHAIEGAIQAAQQLAGKLSAIEAEAKNLASTLVTKVEADAKEAVAAIESKVVSITDAAKKL